MNTAADPNLNIYSLFARHAAENPDKIAVIDAEGETSYGALAKRAAAVSSHLDKQGIGPEEPVGVLMARSTELIAVLLGIWKSGGIYVPFDHDEPPERVLRMLTSSGCRRVLGDRERLGALSEIMGPAHRKALLLENVEAIESGTAIAENWNAAPGGSRLAYLLFTSGSTGEPKAVEVEHRNVATLLAAASHLIGFSEADRYLAISTIAFDASITELFLPLTTGASLLLRDRSLLLDPRKLADEICRYGVTVFQTGPAVWSVILERCPNFPKVRIAITHGEAVPPALARLICRHGDAAWNLYGPTETTVWASGHILTENTITSVSPLSSPIGVPLAHVNVMVADRNGRPVPNGEKGELWIGGPGVARGYRARPNLTNDKFRTMNGIRYYRSGDIVLRDSEGVVHYFGRNDDQMKIRGVRIEPGEVEAVLLKHESVAQAAVTWFETQSGRKAIVAAIVLRPNIACSESELHEAVSEHLPRQMIPSRYLFVPWLPMTTNGKIDRCALRESVNAAAANRGVFSEHREPKNQSLRGIEQSLALIWKDILSIDEVGPETHFFLSGGDSLSAVQMLLEVEYQFSINLAPHLAFEAPTITELAAHVRRALATAEEHKGSGYIFPIVQKGEGPPLFFCQVDLALARSDIWAVPCPLYAIVHWARGSGLLKARSIPQLAARHIESMRAIQPSGPYRLAGYSLGGMIAYEMAQQLTRAGEAVEILFLLDPLEPAWTRTIEGSVPNAAVIKPPIRPRLLNRIRQTVRGPGSAPWMSWLAGALALPSEWRIYSPISWLHYLLVDLHLRSPNRASQLLFPKNRWRAFMLSAHRMMKNYVADHYDGRTVLIIAEDHIARTDTWLGLLSPGTVYQKLPHHGHHELFRQPAIREWMEVLKRQLVSNR